MYVHIYICIYLQNPVTSHQHSELDPPWLTAESPNKTLASALPHYSLFATQIFF